MIWLIVFLVLSFLYLVIGAFLLWSVSDIWKDYGMNTSITFWDRIFKSFLCLFFWLPAGIIYLLKWKK